jgi:hypothetical protein
MLTGFQNRAGDVDIDPGMGPLQGSAMGILGLGLMVAGCAGAATVAGGPARELVISYDDAPTSGSVAFPTNTYESVTRFQLPDGEHRALRLRFQAEAEGSLEITIYASTLFESPGEAIHTFRREISKSDLSDGRDGRWVVEDLVDIQPLKGVVWVGIHRLAGTPSIWASGLGSGQAFVRNNDPTNPMGLLPTKHTPMVCLELAP